MSTVRDTMTTNVLTRMSAQSYYRYCQVTKTILKHKDVFFQAESLNAEDDCS